MKPRRRVRVAAPIDLKEPTGSPISTGQLARYIGFSVQTIRRELEAGELKGFRHGRYREWRITWDDARAYCERLGVLRVS